jgi:hypothetical protein
VHGNRFVMHCILRRISKGADLLKGDEIEDAVIEDAVKWPAPGLDDTRLS